MATFEMQQLRKYNDALKFENDTLRNEIQAAASMLAAAVLASGGEIRISDSTFNEVEGKRLARRHDDDAGEVVFEIVDDFEADDA